MLLYPVDGRWHIPLTLRPESMAAHAGQVQRLFQLGFGRKALLPQTQPFFRPRHGKVRF